MPEAEFDRKTDAYYRALGDGRYRPTIHTQGAWRATEQHMAPVGGLLVHALERHDPNPDLQVARVSFDILGIIPVADGEVRVSTVRPGRTIELLQADYILDGRTAVVARAWRLLRADSASVAAGHEPPMPAPHEVPLWDGMSAWPGGYIDSLEFRSVPGAQPGRGQAWLRTDVPLVHGEDVSPLAQLMALADTANGIAPVLPMRAWMFPNTDLTLHLFRQPVGAWLGFDIHASVGPTGVGTTSSVLHDIEGPFGRAEQIVTVRRLG